VSCGRDDAVVRKAYVREWRRSSKVEARENTRAFDLTRCGSDDKEKEVVVIGKWNAS
jgi:hypothetical protein